MALSPLGWTRNQARAICRVLGNCWVAKSGGGSLTGREAGLLDIALGSLEHLGQLAFTQAIDRPFPAEESVIGEEEKHPAEIVEAVAGVQDLEGFLNSFEDFPVAELPDGKLYGILPFLAPSDELALLVAF